MPTPYGSRGGMAFSADELRVLRSALALALQADPVAADARGCARLADAVEEAVSESRRLRSFLLADLARYREALPGSAGGYLTELEEALTAGYLPRPDDLEALRDLCARASSRTERARREGLLHRCVRLADTAVRTRLPALPRGRSAPTIDPAVPASRTHTPSSAPDADAPLPRIPAPSPAEHPGDAEPARPHPPAPLDLGPPPTPHEAATQLPATDAPLGEEATSPAHMSPQLPEDAPESEPHGAQAEREPDHDDPDPTGHPTEHVDAQDVDAGPAHARTENAAAGAADLDAAPADTSPAPDVTEAPETTEPESTTDAADSDDHPEPVDVVADSEGVPAPSDTAAPHAALEAGPEETGPADPGPDGEPDDAESPAPQPPTEPEPEHAPDDDRADPRPAHPVPTPAEVFPPRRGDAAASPQQTSAATA